MSDLLIDVRDLTKSFGGARALDAVSLQIRPGEVHALCGENGAGKSTLIKILAGSYRPDSGQVLVDGRPLPSDDVRASEAAGIAVIYQESLAFGHLDAVDNIFVGREARKFCGLFLDRTAMRRQTRELLARLGESIDITVPIGRLPMAQRQMVGIARALSQRARLLVMDEPTASLSARETQVLFRIIRQLRSEGVSILYVSHRMEEIFDLSDRVTVLRDGRWVLTSQIKEVSSTSLIRGMVGREIELIAGTSSPETDFSPLPQGEGREPVLRVEDLSRQGVFHEISLSVHAGEIVALAGLVGAGRSEVAQAIFGADRYDRGRVWIGGRPLRRGSIRASMRLGLSLVPEDRQHLGLVLPMPVRVNLTLTVLRSLTRFGLISRKRERDMVSRLIGELHVKAANISMPAESLSGGNQQKLVLGKWLATRPRVLILDEPTRGVDVGAKAEVHRLIRELASRGMATLLISSELPEVLTLSDRILVMRQGRIAGEVLREHATEENVLALALPVESAPGVEVVPA